MKKLVLILIFALFLASLFSIRATKSFFTDTEKSAGNILSVATEFSSTPSPTTSPSPTPTPITFHLVINEVYYDVKSPDKGSETSPNNDEWVELYNNTGQPISLKDWTITDNNSSSIINANVNIPAYGFALLAKDANTWTYWTIPVGVEKISLGQEIGNGLANAGDRLILKDELGSVVDQMSYGNDTTFFVLTPVDEGHSWERSPAGKDTDTATDFIDQANPTPGS